MRDMVVLVTGASTGIGYITARELAKMGATVVMVSRSPERGQEAVDEVRAASDNQNVQLMLCDLSSQAAIRDLAGRFRESYDHLHVLVNNAGAIYLRRKNSVDGLEMTFALNHMGYFQLTTLLLDRLKASAPARIVNVASAAHHGRTLDLDDLGRRRYWGMNVYGESKLMNILFTYELARRLEGTGVTVNAMHPGLTRTHFAQNNGFLTRLFMPLFMVFARSAEKGAETAVYLASAPELEGVTGAYFVDKQAVRSSRVSHDPALQERLWQLSEELLQAPPV